MEIELDCPRCAFHFSAACATPADEIFDGMLNDGPWLALGEGDCFGDMVRTALAARGRLCCPECHKSFVGPRFAPGAVG
jgi:hypothetical protein